MIQQLQQENQALKTTQGTDAQRASADAFKAETDRLKVLLPYMTPQMLSELGLQSGIDAMNTGDIAPGTGSMSQIAEGQMPQGMSPSIMQAIAPIIMDAVQNAPARVQQVVRGPDGMISHVIDSPAPADPSKPSIMHTANAQMEQVASAISAQINDGMNHILTKVHEMVAAIPQPQAAHQPPNIVVNIPPNQPMVRRAVRDANGAISHTIDEPVPPVN